MNDVYTIDYYFDTLATNGIFKNMTQNNIFSDEQKINLDIQFYTMFTQRLPTSYIKAFVVDDVLDVSAFSNYIFFKYSEKWKRLYQLYTTEYNPIENYNSVEVYTDTTTYGKITDIKQDTKNNNNNDFYAFNSTTSEPTQENENVLDGTTKNSETGQDIFKHDFTRKGNIGVTTTQQMAESEVKYQTNFVFWDIVLQDVSKMILIQIF